MLTQCENATDLHGNSAKKLTLMNSILFVGNILLLVPTHIYYNYHKITFEQFANVRILYANFMEDLRRSLHKHHVLFGALCAITLMYTIFSPLLYSTNIFPQCVTNNNKYYICVVLLTITNVSYGIINVFTLYIWCQNTRDYEHIVESKRKYCWMANYYRDCNGLYKTIGSSIMVFLHMASICAFVYGNVYNSNLFVQTIFWVGNTCDIFNIFIMLYKNSMYATIEYVIFTVICALNNVCLLIVLLTDTYNFSIFDIVTLVFSNIFVIGCLLWLIFYLMKVLSMVLYWVVFTTVVLITTLVKMCRGVDRTNCVKELNDYFATGYYFTRSRVVLEQGSDQTHNDVYQNVDSSLVVILLPTNSDSTSSG